MDSYEIYFVCYMYMYVRTSMSDLVPEEDYYIPLLDDLNISNTVKEGTWTNYPHTPRESSSTLSGVPH